MADLTKETIEELRGLLAQYEQSTGPIDCDQLNQLHDAAINALPGLLDAAAQSALTADAGDGSDPEGTNGQLLANALLRAEKAEEAFRITQEEYAFAKKRLLALADENLVLSAQLEAVKRERDEARQHHVWLTGCNARLHEDINAATARAEASESEAAALRERVRKTLNQEIAHADELRNGATSATMREAWDIAYTSLRRARTALEGRDAQ